LPKPQKNEDLLLENIRSSSRDEREKYPIPMPHIMNFGTLYDGKEESKGDEV